MSYIWTRVLDTGFLRPTMNTKMRAPLTNTTIRTIKLPNPLMPILDSTTSTSSFNTLDTVHDNQNTAVMASVPPNKDIAPKPSTGETPDTVHESERSWDLEKDMSLLEMRIRKQSSSMLTSPTSLGKKPTKEPKYECKVCSEPFNTRGKANLHQRVAHPDVPAQLRPFVCDQCGCSYKIKCELTRHEKRHPSDYQGMNRNSKSEVLSYTVAGRELLS